MLLKGEGSEWLNDNWGWKGFDEWRMSGIMEETVVVAIGGSVVRFCWVGGFCEVVEERVG